MPLIYCAILLADGRAYVGKTGGTLHKRRLAHYKDARRGSNTHFHAALRIYPPEQWSWVVIEECPDEEVNTREVHHIDLLDARDPRRGFNLHPGGTGQRPSLPTKEAISKANKGRRLTPEQQQRAWEGRWGKTAAELSAINARIAATLTGRPLAAGHLARQKGRKLSPETRAKMSEAHKNQPAVTGRKASPETRAKMSKAHQGVPKGPVSEETKRKISEAKKGIAPWNKGLKSV